MAELIRRAKALKYHKLVLSAFPFAPSIHLYERWGFQLVGDYHEQGLLDGKWVDTRIMELVFHQQEPKEE
jgi:L-amino acid N-acyltransferase YncA